jgi:hypothetical protein
VVSSQAAMLALNAQPGDLAIRTDVSETFILGAMPPSTLANWTVLLFAAPVTSVAGLTGAISATGLTAALNTFAGDTGTGGTQGLVPAPAAGYAAANRYLKADGTFAIIAVAQVTGAAPLASPTFTGTPGGPTATVGTNTGQFATTAFVQAALAALPSYVTTFNSRTGAVSPTTGDYSVGQVTGAAPLASPTFTGTPAAPTAAVNTNTTQLATTAFVAAAVAAAVVSFNGRTGAVSPTTGDYAVGDVTGAAPLASPTFTGTPAAPTATGGTNTTQLATTAFVTAAVSSKANTASPTFTGVPAAPTAAVNTNTTQIATTAFVNAQITSSVSGVTSFNTRTGTVVATTGDYSVGQVTGAAPLASPTFTGTPAAPTATGGTNTTQIATTAFVTAAVGASVTSWNGRTGAVVPVANDYSVGAITGAAPLASPTFTGTPAAPTATGGTNTTQLATTAFVTTADNLKANLASPTFTGTPAAPTATGGTNTTQIATTAFVAAAVAGAAPVPSSAPFPVGFACLLYNNSSGTPISPNATVAGSTMQTASIDGTGMLAGGATQTGVWKSIGGTIQINGAGLCVRIS